MANGQKPLPASSGVPTRLSESLAQVMWMVGVRPVPDALGRVNKLELIPLPELGRLVDVLHQLLCVFRDLSHKSDEPA